MKEYIILTIVIVFFIFSIRYIVKAIKSIFLEEELVFNASEVLLSRKFFLENSIEELEFDLESQKIDNDEYNSLKDKALNEIDSINKSSDDEKGDNTVSPVLTNGDEKTNKTCLACDKELEFDSNFCKYCGEKV